MTSTARRTTALSGLVLSALILAACGAAGEETPEPSDPSVEEAIEFPRVGTHRGYPQLPVALTEGFLEEIFHQDGAGLEVSPVVSANDAISALRSGNIDVAVSGYDPAGLIGADDILMIAKVEASPETTRLLVAADSEFESVEDLAGQVIGSFTTTPNAIFVNALAEGGLTVDDIEYIPVENDVAASTLASGGISAWLTFDPAAATAEIGGIARAILTGEEFGHLNPIVMYTTRDYLESHAESVVALLQAYDLAVTWINDNKSTGAAAEIVADDTGLPAEVTQLSLDRRNYEVGPIDDELLAWMEEFALLAEEIGVTSGVPDFATLIDNSAYEAAVG